MEETSKQSEYELRKTAEKKMMQEIEAETAAWLNSNAKVKEYLSRFKANDVESFTKRYPSLKAEFMHYGATLGDLPDLMQESYIETAAIRLMDIQYKKLFDIMCMWDAELVQFEDITTSIDFIRWNHAVDNCPYITPISQEEFDLYIQFVNTTDAFERDIDISIADYNYYRDEEKTCDDIPAWFKFEDFQTGHSLYRKLPQVRTKKENVYIKLWREEQDKEINRKYESGELKQYASDDRPEISILHYRHIEQFIIDNESNKEVLQLFRKHYAYFSEQLIRDNEEEKEDGWLTEQVENIIHQLNGLKEKIAVEANEDWRVALIKGFAAYEKNKVLQALPYAYSDYLMRKQLGIANSTEDNDYQKSDMHLIELVRDQILRGREINNEPRDFNF